MEEREKVKETFRMFENSYVVFMSWALEDREEVTSLKVHWLPMTLDIAVIEKELTSYVECVEHERKVLTSMKGRDLNSGKVTFKVKLNVDVKKENIPHVLIINDMEALITVAGRLPLCLNCDKLGHVSRDCRFRYCSKCNSLELREHSCKINEERPLYSAKVKQNNDTEPPDDWGDVIQIESLPTVLPLKSVLTNKIAGLELELSKLQSVETSRNKVTDKNKLEVEEAVGENAAASDNLENQPEASYEEFSEFSDMDEDSVREGDGQEFALQGRPQTELGQTSKSKVNAKKKKSRGGSLNKDKVVKDKNVFKPNPESVASYGKPNPHNTRRKKEEAKFNKILDKREFVFED